MGLMHDRGGQDEDLELFGQVRIRKSFSFYDAKESSSFTLNLSGYQFSVSIFVHQKCRVSLICLAANQAFNGALAPPPAPPPGAPAQPETRLSHLPDGRLNTYNGQPPNARYNEHGQRILPGGGGGARFIPPDEYKEFLQLGHGGIFDLDLDNIDVAPWRERGADVSSYFNYGLDERSWRKYIKSIRKSRLEQHLQNKIEAYGMDSSAVDVDLPPEVRRAIGGWEYAESHAPRSAGPRALPNVEQREATFRFDASNTTDGHYRTTHTDGSGSASAYKILKDNRTYDALDSATVLRDLQQQVAELQREYKAMVESGTLTPQRNVLIQQHMLELKRKIVHHSAQPEV